MSYMLPVDRIRETNSLIAFHHPQPSHNIHILIVPKASYASIVDLPKESTNFLSDLVETVKSLVNDFHLEKTGYRLITNGGNYQDIPQLHFHLISDDDQK